MPGAEELARVVSRWCTSPSETQTAWRLLFERHPNYEVVNVDTTDAVCRALHTLRGKFIAQGTNARLELLYFSSFAGSGKSRFCGKMAEFVSRVRLSDHDAVSFLDSSTWMVNVESPPDAGLLSEWVKGLSVIGVNFNSSRWGLSPLDRSTAEHGLFNPLYLRILFFAKADLASSDSSRAWKQFTRECGTLLKNGTINEEVLATAVEDLFHEMVGTVGPFLPLVLLVDELQKVTEFFSVTHANVGDAYRSELCRLAQVVGGRAVFSSLNSELMAQERISSNRPVQELLRLPPFSSSDLFRGVLAANAERRVYLDFSGTLASWSFTSEANAGTAELLERGVTALACLVGSDARFATYLATHFQSAAAGTGSMWSAIESAASRASFSVGALWNQAYGPVVLAHVLLGRTVSADQYLMDAKGTKLSVTWDMARLRGHVLAFGGETFQPQLPLHAVCRVANVALVPERNILYDGVSLLLSWSRGHVSWCGWEVFFVAVLGLISNSRVLLRNPVDECSLADLFTSSTHSGTGAVVSDGLIEAAQPRYGVNTITVSRLMQSFIAKDAYFVNKVWRLNRGAPALDAALLFTTVYGELVLLCIQLKFSAEDASTTLSWADSCNWVSAMQEQCAAAAGHLWNGVKPRVTFLVAARRRMGANYQDDKASHPRRVMDNAIVVCWEDLRGCTSPFLYSVIEHAETLFEAELEVTATVDD